MQFLRGNTGELQFFMKSSLVSQLETLYRDYTKREYVDPDPLMFLYEYDNPADREIAALIASSLAYGRVRQILQSIRKVLAVMGQSPFSFAAEGSERQFHRFFADFRHRFTTGEDIALLMCGVKKALGTHGSLQQTFLSHYSDSDETLLPALTGFSHELCCFFPEHASYLLPSPEKGSACKRANLMLRWLVRTDEVDPGGWDRVPKSKLLIPLDTHMFRIAEELGLCSRSSANLNAALETTRAFAGFAPEDPVKYDFALTRFGIHPVVSRKKLPLKNPGKGS